jgi:hypothetical protein
MGILKLHAASRNITVCSLQESLLRGRLQPSRARGLAISVARALAVKDLLGALKGTGTIHIGRATRFTQPIALGSIAVASITAIVALAIGESSVESRRSRVLGSKGVALVLGLRLIARVELNTAI